MSAPEPVRCLTLWQPWASLIALGHKRVETRSRATPWRGLLAIHAAARWDPHVRDTVGRVAWRLRYGSGRLDEEGLLGHMAPSHERLTRHRGCVVALARVVACEAMTDESIDGETLLELEVGDWQPGRYAWRLEDVRPLSEPLALKGRQGMWTLPADVAAEVLARAESREVPRG